MYHFWPRSAHCWPPIFNRYNSQYNHIKQKRVDYLIDLHEFYPNIKMKMCKNNDRKNTIEKMTLIGIVGTNGTSTIPDYLLNNYFFINFLITFRQFLLCKINILQVFELPKTEYVKICDKYIYISGLLYNNNSQKVVK